MNKNFYLCLVKSIFKICMLIFCLGIFVIPSQVFASQNTKMECCQKTKSENDNCCHHKKENPTKHCNDNSCSQCNTCFSLMNFIPQKSEKALDFKKSFYQKSNFIYQSPSFSFYLEDIWQPPKIG